MTLLDEWQCVFSLALSKCRMFSYVLKGTCLSSQGQLPEGCPFVRAYLLPTAWFLRIKPPLTSFRSLAYFHQEGKPAVACPTEMSSHDNTICMKVFSCCRRGQTDCCARYRPLVAGVTNTVLAGHRVALKDHMSSPQACWATSKIQFYLTSLSHCCKLLRTLIVMIVFT